MNAWRNLSPEPVENDHLAVCDAKSISEDHLLMMGANSSSPQPTALRRSPCLTAENFTERVSGPMARFDCSSEHRWYYYPKLREACFWVCVCVETRMKALGKEVCGNWYSRCWVTVRQTVVRIGVAGVASQRFPEHLTCLMTKCSHHDGPSC